MVREVPWSGGCGVRLSTLVKRLLGVDRHVVVEGVEFEVVRRGRLRVREVEVLVVRVRPQARWRGRCGVCGARCPGYDGGRGRRRWRGLDLGVVEVYLEAAAPRVHCGTHGVVVAQVPWARHGSRFTTSFEDTCAWLTARASMSTVARYLRTTWQSVHAIVERVVAEPAGGRDMLGGPARIGIDEPAHRKGHRYVTVVIDHDTGGDRVGAQGPRLGGDPRVSGCVGCGSDRAAHASER